MLSDYFLLFVLGIDCLYLLTNQIHIILQLLYLAVHLVDKAVTLLRACIQESKVVLVSLNLLLQSLILTEQACTLVVESILTTLGYLLQVLLEVTQLALCSADVKILIEFVENSMILLVELILLFKWNMSNSIVLLNKFLYLFCQALTSFLCNSLQLLDNLQFLIQILAFLTTLSCTCSITCLEECVACTKKLSPQLVAKL
mgnify:CR=1 FL=1